ncbi:MAG TPA: TIGR03086 family metal-binding protein [Acetobacteraceae bacterium]|nr:TIGR03086 family metal-binding protein [Acetobacteraceae bacterium]
MGGRAVPGQDDRASGQRTRRRPGRRRSWQATAYRRSVQVAQNAVEAPGAMQAICHLSFGDYSGADYAAQLFMDALIHGWDIAKGTGQNTRLDPELVAACHPIAEELTRQFRQAGVFGEDLPVSADADPQTRLLALLGRSA